MSTTEGDPVGQTGAEFGPASTQDLVDRVIERINREVEALPKPTVLNKGSVTRRLRTLTEARSKILADFDMILSGDGNAASEAQLRRRLEYMLSPSSKERLLR